MNESDYVEIDRKLSQDKSKMLISYMIDLGAFGYGKVERAVINTKDTLVNLRTYDINEEVISANWLNNDTILGKVDIFPSIRSGTKPNLKSQSIIGVNVILNEFDYIEPTFKIHIEHREISPNRRHEIVAYRYCKDRSNLNFIHVSVINVGEEIPKYGNYLIADKRSDLIFGSEWTADNKLVFHTNKFDSELIQYYLVKNRPEIEFEIKVDEQNFKNKSKWVKNGSR
jgi:hypothetical protein